MSENIIRCKPQSHEHLKYYRALLDCEETENGFVVGLSPVDDGNLWIEVEFKSQIKTGDQIMALPKPDCKFCCGTGYRMGRVIPNDIRPEIVEIMSGGGVIPTEVYQEALERADEVIDLVLTRHEQEDK